VKTFTAFFACCRLLLRDVQSLDGNRASLLHQIISELLVFFSSWHRSNEVFDKAVAYFFWIEKNETKSMAGGK
jgi:hypothetical protein